MNWQLLNQPISLAARKLHASSLTRTAKPSPLIDSIIRVDHAGELGADRIYAGQMAVLGNTKVGPVIQHMWDQEKVHKATFEELIVKYRVRPTVLVPVWNVAGFLLGAATSLMGEKAAMACTVAVESVIVEHYNDQLRTLMAEPEKPKELLETIQKFRDDEQEHHDSGIDHGAEQAPFYRALSEVIKIGCKTAIALSKGLLSHKNQSDFIISRNYSTSVEPKQKLKWDLYSAVCLERKPIIMKPFNELEQKYIKFILAVEVERSLKSNHEIKAEIDRKRMESYRHDSKVVESHVVLQKTAQDFEDISNKEFDNFHIATRETLADKKNNVRSLNRSLSNHLLFLINEKLGNRKQWMLPQGIRENSETMRETAERILRQKCGDNLNVLFLGNAPCGFYKYKYPKEMECESIGAKVFFFKALYVSGNVEIRKESDTDYQWVTRSSLRTLLDSDKYYEKVSMFLIEDEVS